MIARKDFEEWQAKRWTGGLGGCKEMAWIAWQSAVTFTLTLVRKGSNEHSGLTEGGERVPPIQGDVPCEVYDPAGEGAGLECDGFPQCASCGYPKVFHGLLNLRTKVISLLSQPNSDVRQMGIRNLLREIVLPRPKPQFAQPPQES